MQYGIKNIFKIIRGAIAPSPPPLSRSRMRYRYVAGKIGKTLLHFCTRNIVALVPRVKNSLVVIHFASFDGFSIQSTIIKRLPQFNNVNALPHTLKFWGVFES